MDPVTHGLVGATSAQLFADKQKFRLASLIGGIAALAPDLDIFLGSSSDPLLTLELHRHFTHSLLFIPIGSLIVAGICWWFVKSKLSFKETYFFSVCGYATAGFMDVVTSYGVHLFWPFTETRFSLDIVSVFDPLFTIALLILFLLAIFKVEKKWTVITAFWVISYLGFAAIQQHRATKVAVNHIQEQHPNFEQLIIKPTIANQVLWSARYINNSEVCAIGIRVGIFSNPYAIPGECVPLLDWKTFIAQYQGTVLYDDISRFDALSSGYLVLHPNHPNVIGDARYSMLPTTIAPLWGISIDTTSTNNHVNFDNYRDTSKETREAFLEMVFPSN